MSTVRNSRSLGALALMLVVLTATACVPADDTPPIPPWRPSPSQQPQVRELPMHMGPGGVLLRIPG